MGKSIRRPVSPKRQLKKNICFLVEGTTEENVIDHLYNRTDFPRISFHKAQYGGGGYVDIKHWIAKRRDRLDIAIVVSDLDRAAKKKEKETLIEVIHFCIEKILRIIFFLHFRVSVKFSSVIHLTVDNYYLRGFGLISISV